LASIATASGSIYTLNATKIIASTETLVIDSGLTLVIPDGLTLTNNGTIVINGTLTNNGGSTGGFVNNSTKTVDVNPGGAINNSASYFTNNALGTIIISGGATFLIAGDSSVFSNAGTFRNQGIFKVIAFAQCQNSGTFNNEDGVVTNFHGGSYSVGYFVTTGVVNNSGGHFGGDITLYLTITDPGVFYNPGPIDTCSQGYVTTAVEGTLTESCQPPTPPTPPPPPPPL